jgi:DNA-binding transcriptional regulator PaaX
MKSKKEDDLAEVVEKFLHSNTMPAVVTKTILISAALGGIAFGGAIVPGILKALRGLEADNSNYSDKKIRNAFYALKRRKFIKIIKNKKGKITVKLTNKGKKRVREFVVGDLMIIKQIGWDKKWRVLIFDIPIKKNWAREALRKKIKELGFYQFQGSVWFFPFPCEDEILTIAEFFGVSEYIEIITAENVLHEKELKKYFKLK